MGHGGRALQRRWFTRSQFWYWGDCRHRFRQRRLTWPWTSPSKAMARFSLAAIIASGAGNVALVRYLSDGTLDPGFGLHGLVSMDFASGYDLFHALTILPDGKIMVAANAFPIVDQIYYTSRIGLARFLPDGSLDATFGTSGIVLANPRAPSDDMALALAVQRNGMVVVGGQALSRYTAAGAVDPRFHVSVYDQYPIIYSLAIQPDGKIVAAGVFRPYTFDVWLARFEGDDADVDAPTAAPAQSPPPNPGGWNNGDVTISWNWSDGTGSGIDTANCTQQSTSVGEGEIQLVATCQDLAGNQARAAYTVKVDKTPPTIVAGADTVTGISWYNRDVRCT